MILKMLFEVLKFVFSANMGWFLFVGIMAKSMVEDIFRYLQLMVLGWLQDLYYWVKYVHEGFEHGQYVLFQAFNASYPESHLPDDHPRVKAYILRRQYGDLISKFTLLEVVGMLAIAWLVATTLVETYLKIRKNYGWFLSRGQSLINLPFDCERMRPGSLLEAPAVMPSFQAEVWIRYDGGFSRSGQGFLTKFGFVTAYHVVAGVNEVQLRRGDKHIIMSPERFIEVENDMAYAMLTSQEITALQISQGEMTNAIIPKRSGVSVKITAFGQQSMGLLEKSSIFGVCYYHGSTIKGFSGAPYYVGKKVYAMHFGASNLNMAFEAAYIYMVLAGLREDTQDALEKQIIEDEEEFRWSRSPYDPDEARVEIGGRYYSMSMDFVRRVVKKREGKRNIELRDLGYEDEAINELPVAPATAMPAYKDGESSKNLLAGPKRVPIADASGTEELSTGELDTAQKGLLDLLNGITLESRKSLANSLLSGQQLTPAQLSAVLRTTPKSTKKQKKKSTSPPDLK